MQKVKQHRFLVLLSILLVAILIVSVVAYIQAASQPAPTPTSTPTPTPSPTASASPTPTQTSPTPTSTTPTPSATTQPTMGFPSTSVPSGSPSPGEITQYQGVNLTPISTYIQYLNAHPDVAIAGVQNIDQQAYRLKITGLVNSPQSLTYAEVVDGFPSTLEVSTLPCVEGWSVTMLWEGVPITDLLDHAGGVDSSANTIIFLAADGYSSSLPLQHIKDYNTIVAYKMNNLTLTPKLGWPLFLVATNQYGYKWVEWITEINVSNDSTYQGYWESRGYPNDAPVQTDSGSSFDLRNNPVVLPVALGLLVVLAVAVAVFYSRRENRPRPQSRFYFTQVRVPWFRKNIVG